MNHLTVGVFGDRELAKKLGKSGNINDIAIYSHASSEGVYTFVVPNSQENRVQTLLQCVNMIDTPVVVAEEIGKELAEQIVALDAFGFEKGFVVSNSENLRNIIKGTSLERYEWVSDDKELREKIKVINPLVTAPDVWIPIDNYFNVRSVGTVVLCVVKGGQVRKHDKLRIEPLGKEAIVRSIQSQDKDIDEASIGTRVGLNLKGVEADELKRGYVLCREAVVGKDISIIFKKSDFSKEEAKEGMHVILSAGLQVVTGKIGKAESGVLHLTLDQPVSYLPGQKCMLATIKQSMPRIIGSGSINK